MAKIEVKHLGGGIAEVTIRAACYPQVGAHWKRVLSGSNAKRWGRIYIDPSKAAAEERRADAMWEEGRSTRGMPQANRDECPGAMFIWETQDISDVEVCCASANQAFGRDLYKALKDKLLPIQKYGPKGRLSWWEVKFKFI
jgi:hypothetical protein